MMSTWSRVSYLGRSAAKLLDTTAHRCPSCANPESVIVVRKWGVTALRRCAGCQLLFRTPTTTDDESRAFYQHEYSQGITTDLPSDAELAVHKSNRFKNSEKDYSQALALLQAIGCNPPQRILDFGCSWGYGSWQFTQAGYDVVGFEVSLPRADYARSQLGVRVATRLEEIDGAFDVFFSSHVLEHVPSVAETIDFARRVVKPGAWFTALTPNGSDNFRERNEHGWMKSWGLVHPNLLDDRFYAGVFKSIPLLLASCPYDLSAIQRWASANRTDSVTLELSGAELLAVARLG